MIIFKNLNAGWAACLLVAGLFLLVGDMPSYAEDAKKEPVKNAVGVGSGWSAQVAPNGTTGIELDENQLALVRKVSEYFNTLPDIKGRFIQTGGDKKVMRGKFYLQRPGKFRFDYNRPSLQVIISDGHYLAIQDHDLNNEDRVQLDSTPFRILLRKDVDLLRDARIVEVQDTGDKILLALQDKSPDTPGRIKLVFETKPELELSEWYTLDAQGLETRTQIGNLDKSTKLEASLFKIKPLFNSTP